MSYSVVFVSGSVSPTNKDLKNGSTVNVSFYKNSGVLPTAGAVLKSVRMTWSSINVYGNSRYLSCAYGTFYPSYSSGSHSGNLMNVGSDILRFTGGTIGFTVGGAGSSTSNALNVRSECVVTLTIEWEARTASTGRLSSTQGMHGYGITLDISATDPSFTHEVIWSRGSGYTSSETVEAGIASATLTVPPSWPVGAATVSLKTFLNGSQVGATQTYSWNVVVDGSKTFPSAGTLSASLVQDSRIPPSWNVFVQGYSKARLALSGYGAGASASITNIELSLGELRQSDTKATFDTPVLTETGELIPKAVVTNNFGNQASTSASSIKVHAYESPKVANLVAYRCLQNGTPNDFGTYIAVKATVEISSVSNLNGIVTLQAQYRKLNSSGWSSNVANLDNDTTAVFGGDLTANDQYEVRVVIADSIQNRAGTFTTKTSIVLTSECVLFFRDGGLNMSIGTEGTRDNAVELNGNWHFWHGDFDWTPLVEGVRDIAHGGTGAGTAQQAVANLGAAPASHKHNAADLTSGSLPIGRGGTGASDAASARSNLGITPSNIGAAASSHNHNASSITAGTLAAARLPFRIQYGTVSLTGVSWSHVSLSGFSSTPIVLVAYTDDSSSSNIKPLKTRSRSTSGFDVCMAGSSGSGSRTVCWLAIGT